ncbi:glycosyltransferase [Pararoseomonas sp. SCSIO 73927]|uniref:glycosyltransferase family 2 protein n=1 Tax=Pararoseomonas sp. SCSIO 73927 TaxID=3114537 RepID=UPI0030D43C25
MAANSLVGSVSVVVPNYNYARYLPERFASIVAQGRIVRHLTFLDDASSDNSMEMAEPLLAGLSIPVTVQRNAVNSGSVFRQWARGAEAAEAPFLWIAEADDSARPEMLDALARRLSGDPTAAFAFSDSAAIDADGAVTQESSKPYAAMLGDDVLNRDATLTGREFVGRCLCPRNLVVSASAVLWRTEALRAALGSLGDSVGRWRCAGDWRIYAEAARPQARMHYEARPFNLHRRHASSVTGSIPAASHFAEVVAMHSTLRRLLDRGADPDERMRRYLRDLRHAWHLG